MNTGENEPRGFITPEKLYRPHKSSLLRTFEETQQLQASTLGTPTRLYRESLLGADRKSVEGSELGSRKEDSLRESVLSLNLKAVEQELRFSGVQTEMPTHGPTRTIQAVPISTEESEGPLRPIEELRWCAACGREVATTTKYVNSKKTFWSSVAIFALGGVVGCFMIPYCSDSCKDVKRVCMRCSRELTL